jgi:hypothetical protein
MTLQEIEDCCRAALAASASSAGDDDNLVMRWQRLVVILISVATQLRSLFYQTSTSTRCSPSLRHRPGHHGAAWLAQEPEVPAANAKNMICALVLLFALTTVAQAGDSIMPLAVQF